jgi:phage-related minor tail protein
MVDFADLGMRFKTEGLEEANRGMDTLVKKSVEVTTATEAMVATTNRAIAQQTGIARSTGGAASAIRQQAEAVLATEAAMRAQLGITATVARANDAATMSAAAAATATKAVGTSATATAVELANYEKTLLAATIAQTGMTEAQARASLAAKGLIATQKMATAAAVEQRSAWDAVWAGDFVSQWVSATKATKTMGEETVKAATHMKGSSLIVREFLVILREMSRLNFTRMAGSVTILAGAFGILTASVVTMAAVIALLAAPFAVLAFAFVKGQEESAKLNNALAATGGYAGMTASSFEDMGRRISKSQDIAIGDVKADMMQLVASGKFTADTIELMIHNAEAYAKLTGEKSADILKNYEDMKGGVVKWAVKHEEVYHDLTYAQILYVEQLEKSGQHALAEWQIQKDIADNIKDRMVPQYGLLQRVLHDVATSASDMWDKILGVGREKSIGDQIGDLKTKVENESRGSGDTGASGTYAAKLRADHAAQLDSDRRRLAVLTGIKQVQDEDAAARAKEKQTEDDKIRKRWDTAGGKGRKAPEDTSDQVIAQATKEELAARAGLTKNITELADLRLQEIVQDLREKDDRLKRSLHEKRITDAAYKIALAKDKEAADEKSQLIIINRDYDLAAQALKQRTTILGYQDQQMQAQAALAATADEAGRFELKSLDARQQLERDQLKMELDYDVKMKLITRAAADEQISAQGQAQIARRILVERNIQFNIAHEHSRRLQDDVALQIEVLQSQADAAKSAFERVGIEQKILDASQELARLKEQEIIDTTVIGSAEHDAAVKRMTALKTIQRNEQDAAHSFNKSFTDASQVVTDMANAIRNHDWAALAAGLEQAFAVLRNASASTASKIGAIAGIGNAIGNAVGGTAGSTISGIASGAALGTTILPGIGTAIGAVVGGIAGFFSGSSQKKQQQQQEAAQKAAAEAQKALDIANQKRELEITLMDLQGNAAGALAARRHDELAAMDASNRALAEQVYAAQDAAEAKAKQEDIDKSRRKLEIDLATASGDAIGSLNMKRADELAQLDKSLQPLQQAIFDLTDANDAAAKSAQEWADKVSAAQDQVNTDRQNLISAYEDEAQTLKATRDQVQSFLDGITTFRSTLLSGDAAGLDPLAQYAASRAEFTRISGLAAAGDASGQAGLQDAISSFLAASKTASTDPGQYSRDRAAAIRAIDLAQAAAKTQISVADQQLAEIKTQVDLLGGINSNTNSIAGGISALSASMAALAAAIAGQTAAAAQQAALVAAAQTTATAAHTTATRAFDANSYLSMNPDVAAAYPTYYNNQSGWVQSGFGVNDSLAQFAADHYRIAGQSEGRSFQTGGSFQVGGSGGPDSKYVSFYASPNEMVNITHGNSNDEVANAIDRLADEMRSLRIVTEKTEKNTGDTKNILTRVTRDGNSLVTVDEAA